MLDENNYIPFEDYSRRPDDVTPEDMETSEPKDAEITNLPRNTFIPKFDKVVIEGETANLINYLSALVLSATDYLFEYSAHRTSNPDQAELALTKATNLLDIADPLAKKFIDLSE